jgi:hypothetical protein
LNKIFVLFILILFGGCTSTARQKLGFGYTKCAEDLIHGGYMQAGEDRVPLELKFKEAESICANTPENQIIIAKKMWDANFYSGESFNRSIEDAKSYSLNQLHCAEVEFTKNKSLDKRFYVSDACKKL